ncbi:hypothetical protein LSH36_501g08068 [Paralvinella palmiformis]|uniref:Uncharacterized protein n=1 Tax=Paralvinella palmiformis TaxID=53620 RepID=A0AAD9J8S0_9ANNE|nr:hypothetical protein LSH36_501g08068 [Paralvinella palmiformis]
MWQISSREEDDDEPREKHPSSVIKEMIKLWESVLPHVEKYLPNKAVDVRSTNLLKQNGISHFRNILKRRQKQISMDNFVVRRKFEPNVSESEPSVEP